MNATQAITQANKPKTLASRRHRTERGVSIWSYKTSAGARWAFELRLLEKGEIRKVQRRGFLNKPAAMEAATHLEFEGKSTPAASVTFEQLLLDYVSQLSGTICETSRANYYHLVSLYCRDSLFTRKVASLGIADFQRLLYGLANAPKNLRPGTINTLRSRLIALFNYGLQIGACQINPVKLVKPAKAFSQSSSTVSEPWSVSEANLARKVFEGTRLEIFLDFALYLGLRKGEILALTWADLDLEPGLVRITKSYSQRRTLLEGKIVTSESNGETKTASSIRSLPIPGPLLKKLRGKFTTERPNAVSPVVALNGRHWSISNLAKEYRRICNDGNLRLIRIHDIRHTSAVLSLLGNAPLEAVSQALGHTGVEVTKRYYAKRVSTFPQLFSSGVEKALSDSP